MIAIVGGLIVILRALLEVRRNREQRELELKWNRAKLAKEFLDEIERDILIQNAKNMIDLNKRKYEISESQIEIITTNEVLDSLKKELNNLIVK